MRRRDWRVTLLKSSSAKQHLRCVGPCSSPHSVLPVGQPLAQGRGLRLLWVFSRKHVRDKNSPSQETCPWEMTLPKHRGQAGCQPHKACGRGSASPWVLSCHAQGQQEDCSLGPRQTECLRPEQAMGDCWVVSGGVCGCWFSLHLSYSSREPSQLFPKLRKIHKVKSSLRT